MLRRRINPMAERTTTQAKEEDEEYKQEDDGKACVRSGNDFTPYYFAWHA